MSKKSSKRQQVIVKEENYGNENTTEERAVTEAFQIREEYRVNGKIPKEYQRLVKEFDDKVRERADLIARKRVPQLFFALTKAGIPAIPDARSIVMADAIEIG